MTTFNNAFKVKQALGVADFNITDYFPVVGKTVGVTNTSTDNDSNLWTLNDGVNAPYTSTNENETVTILGTDNNTQTLEITNTVNVDTHSEIVYGIEDPTEPYYEITVENKVCRVGDNNTITLVSKYDNPNTHSVYVEILNSADNTVFYSEDNVTGPITIPFTLRGSFNIRVVATTDGEVVESIQYRLITVTPALAPIGEAIVLELEDTITSFGSYGTYTNSLDGDITSVPPGSTVVLSLVGDNPEELIYRVRLVNLKGTLENPIVITIDESEQLRWNFDSWYGVWVGNCEHIVLDGKGYQNLVEGWHMTRLEESEDGEIGIQVGGGTNYIETHNIEFSNAFFAGMVCKTDPDKDTPEYWRGNFTMEATHLHNCYFHNTRAEGIYYGYFDTSEHTEINSEGTEVTYRAHALANTKIYRNRFIQTGWDALQLNNATENTEIHDNYIEDSAFFGEPDQNTGMSLGMEGKIFNNIINGCTGLGIQVGALGPLDVFNNVIYNLAESNRAFYLLSGEGVPEQNVGGTKENNIPIRIFNNNLITSGMNSTVGAQDVCQYLGLVFVNNITSGAELFSGQDSSTIVIWESNATNNVVIDVNNLNQYKFGSFYKGEFNLYPSSVLASGGSLIGTQYDARGFKNWTDLDKPIGAFAGIVKVAQDILILSSLTINNGDENTPSLDVVITFTFLGNPTQYMVSEDPLFTGGVWVDYTPGDLSYQMTSAQGVKTIYGKIRNATIESETVSDTIEHFLDRQFLVTFSRGSGYVYPSNWNAIHGLTEGTAEIPIGTTVENLIDQNGTPSSLILTVSAPFTGVDSNLKIKDEVYPYPMTVVDSTWIIVGTGAVGSLILSGCDDNKTYDIVMYAHRDYTGQDQYLSIDGVDQILNAADTDLHNQVVFNNIQSTNGEFVLDVKVIHDRAFISLIDITEK